MPQPRFITSESQMGAPGVYVQEGAPAVPIRGQRRRIVGFVGQCLRGPVGKIVTCVDYQRFIDVFGGRDRNVRSGPIAGHVWAALQGYRWGRFEVVRVAAADAVKASFTVESHESTLDLDVPLTGVDTILETTALAGNAPVTIAFVADGAGTGSFTRSGYNLTFHFQTATTTVANFEAAVGALSGADALIAVLTAGTGATTFAAGDVHTAIPFQTVVDGSTTPVLRIDASSVGAAGNDIGFKITRATDANPQHFNLQIRLYGSVKTYENVDISGTNNNLSAILGNDDALLVTVTKLANGIPALNEPGAVGADGAGFTNLGSTVAGFTSVSGSDGTIADTDYTASGAMDLLNDERGIHACAVVGRSSSDIRSKASDLAAVSAQRVWYVCPNNENTTYTDAIAERSALSGDRLTYWFNHAQKTDPVTRELIWEEPFIVVMSIISQTDPDIHPGDFDNSVLTRAIRSVKNTLGEGVRDALDLAGVSYLLRDLDQSGNSVIIPGNALTCDLLVNNRDLDGRYMKDFIIDALANRLRGDQFKGNTNANRAERASACSGFLDTLARSERYVMLSEDGKPLFSYTNNASVNTLDNQAAGDQREVCVVRLIPKNKRILLNITIGVDASVSEQ